MKKNIFLTILTLFLCTTTSVFAQTIKVEALECFSTLNPPSIFSLKTLEDVTTNTNTLIPKNSVIKSRITTVKNANRLKQNATFTITPFEISNNEGTKQISGYKAQYTTALDKGELAQSAALSIGTHFVKGMATGVYAFKGFVNNKEGNRLKSTVDEVYDNSPFSYVEKGEEIEIKKGDIFLLNFTETQD